MTRMRRVATIVTLGTIGAFAGITTASAGGGCHSGVTEGHGTRVEMVDACFTPTTLFAEPGEAITFVSRDELVHNITANDWGHFDDLHEGERYTTSFTTDGTYAYACTYHPGMSGAIVIGEGAVGADIDPEPVTSSVVNTTTGGDRIAAGAIGLLIGAVVGTGLASVCRRATGA